MIDYPSILFYFSKDITHIMKKRILNAAAGFVFFLVFIPSCDLFENCGECELVTVQQDNTTSYGTPLLYCDESLAEKEDSNPVTVAGITTYWNCY